MHSIPSGIGQSAHLAQGNKSSLRDTVVMKTVMARKNGSDIKYYEKGLEKAKKANLTEDEFLAIHSYTTDFYKIFNAFKRGQTEIFKHEVKEFKNVVSSVNDPDLQEVSELSNELFTLRMYVECKTIGLSLNSGLDKLPSYEGIAIRGDLLSKQEKDDIEKDRFKTPTVLSCSDSDKDWKKWGLRSPTNGDEIHPSRLEIVSKHGKDISPYSASPSEGEVVFKPGTTFSTKEVSVVTTIYENTKRKYVSIFLEENG